MPRARARQEGAQCTTSEIPDAKYDREFALGNGRNTSGRVIRDQSVAEETVSVPGVRSLARRPNYKTLEGPAGNWFEVCACSRTHNQPVIMLMPMRMTKDQTTSGWQRQNRRVPVSVVNMVLWSVWWIRTISRKPKPFQYLS